MKPTVLCRGWSNGRGVNYRCYLPGAVLQQGDPGPAVGAIDHEVDGAARR